MKNYTVRLVPLEKEFSVREGTPLIDILHEYGVEFPCGGRGRCGKCRIRILKGEIEADRVHQMKLRELGLGSDWRLSCHSQCHGDLVLEVGQYESLIRADDTPFQFVAGDGLGIAFDLGTTTLVGQLLDLKTGRILAVEKGLNPQGKLGSDLVTRLEASLGDGGHEARVLIRQQVARMVERLMEGRGTTLDRMILVGNTVMHHFFSGLDITPLSFFPFESPETGMISFSSQELGWSIRCEDIRFYPSLGSFVGSDILAGIMATGMHQRDEFSVLVDLGTNGEIVVGNRDGLLCASTAAGPAFEGSCISCGMLATTGAIASVRPEGDGWQCRVIGEGQPKGICGSGLIDVVAVLLQQGRIGMFGEIKSGEQEVVMKGPVTISQKDLQEFLLAKSALSTGIQLLLNKLGISKEKVEQVYIAGGFGSYLNLENVNRTGMFEFPSDKMTPLGNTALMGAKMFLFDNTDAVDEIRERTTHVRLEAEPGFQDLFIENMVLAW